MIIITATRRLFSNITKFQGFLKSKKPVKFFSWEIKTTPVTIKTRILILAIGVNRLVISCISLPTTGADSRATFALGSITNRISIIPPIHITVAKRWKKWLKVNISGFILPLRYRQHVEERRQRALTLSAASFGTAKSSMRYLDFIGFLGIFSSFVALVLFCFSGIQPQPQVLFLSPIFITSFLWIVVRGFDFLIEKTNPSKQIRRISKYLNTIVKKFTYLFLESISLILPRTILSSFSISS